MTKHYCYKSNCEKPGTHHILYEHPEYPRLNQDIFSCDEHITTTKSITFHTVKGSIVVSGRIITEDEEIVNDVMEVPIQELADFVTPFRPCPAEK